MRVVVQRVKEARVEVESRASAASREVGRIGRGLLVFLGVAEGDGEKEADYLARKVLNLRIFEDDEGRMQHSALDLGLELLVISQFTLLGRCEKGNRPDFTRAMKPPEAERLYEYYVGQVGKELKVATGEFGARMLITAVNDGPVTITIESKTS